MANNKLQQYFPIIRTREEIWEIINNYPGLSSLFYQWSISDESSLVVMDILVKLKDGSIANVEIPQLWDAMTRSSGPWKRMVRSVSV